MSARRPPLDARDLEGLADAVAREREITKRRVQQWISYMVLGSQLERTASERDGPRFTIKGGVALELRLSGKARATRDIDLIVEPGENDDLVSALRTALEDTYQGFTFRVKGKTYQMPTGTERVDVAVQYQVFSPPDFWREEFEARAAELGLAVTRLDDAIEEVREYVRELDTGDP